MPAIDASSPSKLLPWQQYTVLACINIVVIVTVVGMCACCYSSSTSKASEAEEVDDEEDDFEDDDFDTDDVDSQSVRKPLLTRTSSTSSRTKNPTIRIKDVDDSSPESERKDFQTSPNDIAWRGRSLMSLNRWTRKKYEERSSESSDDNSTTNTNKTISFRKESVQPVPSDFPARRSLKTRSKSVPSFIPHSPSLGRHKKFGKICFSLSYSKQVLELTIQKGCDLPAIDLNGTSDPYVKIFLFPDRKQKFETRIIKRNLNPVWNETFRFEGYTEAKLDERSLYLQVFDHDRFTKDDVIGELEIELCSVTLQSEPLNFERELKPCKHSKGGVNDLGCLLVSICYTPTDNNITINVMKGSRMPTTDVSGKSDPFVKVYMMYSGKKVEKRKTRVVKRSLNPVWNDIMEFDDVKIDKIRGISFVFTVMDFDAVLPNKYVGKVIIGYSTTGSSLKHWTDVLTNPGKPIAQWHRIIKY